jgi:hypothetical protein
MVTEDEVRGYGYRTQLFADGKNAKGRFAVQISVCSTNPRLTVYWNSQTGQRFFVAGSSWSIHRPPGLLKGSTPRSPT